MSVVEDVQQEMLATLYVGQCFPEIRSRIPFGGWAASAAFIAELVSDILMAERREVLDCGSGLSTLYAAAAVRRLGRGRVVALEHDPAYAARTRRMLALNDLAFVATVLDAPLARQPVEGGTHLWYDVPADAAEGPFDLVIVDGPPQKSSLMARFGAISRLRQDRPLSLLIDDAHTPETRGVIEAWRGLLDFGAPEPTSSASATFQRFAIAPRQVAK